MKKMNRMDDDFNFTSIEDEQQLEEIRGENSKKPRMNILNQKKLSKWEMDELFLDGESTEEYEEEM